MRTSQFLWLWAAVTAFHLITYFGSQYLEGEPRTVGWRLDERIPFLPGFVYVYCSWFPLLFFVPALLCRYSPALCLRYFIANVLDLGLSTVVFLLVPTTFQRPALTGRGFTHFVMKTVYSSNHRFLNCAPSVHCSVSLLVFFAMLAAPAVPAALRLTLGALSLAIVCSTLLVKQHVLIDVLTAVPTALLCALAAALPSAGFFLRLFGLS